MRKRERKLFGLVFWVSYFAYSALYIARLNFSVASALFESMGILDKSQIGIIGSIFAFTFAIAKVPNGFLGDRKSTRKIIVIGLLITSISNLLIGVIPRFWSIAILWGLNAYGQSMLWGPLLRSFSETYTQEQYTRISQFLVSSVAVGSILGLVIATECATLLGAAACFLIPGMISLLMAVLARFFILDVPGHPESEKINLLGAFRNVLSSPKFRKVIFPAVSHGMVKDNINVWLAVYFIDVYGVDVESMVGYIFFIPVFAFAGRMLYPVLYRKFQDAYYVSSTAFAVCAFVSILLCVTRLPMYAALLGLGVISAMISVINTHMLSAFPSEFSDSGSLSFVASVMDLLTYGGAGIGSLVFGVLIQAFGYGSMFAIWGAASAVSIVMVLRARKVAR